MPPHNPALARTSGSDYVHCPRHAERMPANPTNRAPARASPLIVDRYLRNAGPQSENATPSCRLTTEATTQPRPIRPVSRTDRTWRRSCVLIRILRILARRIRPTRRKWTPRGYRILRTGHILHAIPGSHASGFPWLSRTPLAHWNSPESRPPLSRDIYPAKRHRTQPRPHVTCRIRPYPGVDVHNHENVHVMCARAVSRTRFPQATIHENRMTPVGAGGRR